MERASVDQLLTVMAPFTLGQETKRFTPSRPTSKAPLKTRGQYAVRNAQRTGCAPKNLLRKYGGKHDYELKAEGR